MSKPRLLDLFCGAGGAGMGYSRAGFEVVGVDVAPQPHYPFTFIQADAMTYPLDGFDAVHASPPCQHYSALSNPTGNAASWPDLIGPVRELLRQSGLPYVIENVARSPLQNYIELCGTMFGLRVLRHRWFEMSDPPLMVPHCAHAGSTFDGTYIGHAEGGKDRYGKPRPNWSKQERQDAIGIDWMTRHEMREAVPPAYTEWIGTQLLASLRVTPSDPGERRDDAVKMPSMEAALLTALTPSLQPTGEHRTLLDGYCPDCCGAPCIKTWLGEPS